MRNLALGTEHVASAALGANMRGFGRAPSAFVIDGSKE